mmetsp:Transcript_15748/g.15891  ORF Transcript_15748/g.15891 Transcript_15748/m.15891 type:complete len:1143 (+) Transcript_15748:164-3592(+)|eukprot:CAMPEP_0182436974 /NCGR_PEP_ID=MMETSP1167-20130531/84719_1 /TAXON_ID=2988 /ORGANISM="Mallomonas Sp, Strain CCMP3275" /LENGTH=1142 /DNA_ID=CAMNT_0024629713 /DNA_START=43 /DNA_END=3471 /DNA_ORIENTATION=-
MNYDYTSRVLDFDFSAKSLNSDDILWGAAAIGDYDNFNSSAHELRVQHKMDYKFRSESESDGVQLEENRYLEAVNPDRQHSSNANVNSDSPEDMNTHFPELSPDDKYDKIHDDETFGSTSSYVVSANESEPFGLYSQSTELFNQTQMQQRERQQQYSKTETALYATNNMKSIDSSPSGMRSLDSSESSLSSAFESHSIASENVLLPQPVRAFPTYSDYNIENTSEDNSVLNKKISNLANENEFNSSGVSVGSSPGQNEPAGVTGSKPFGQGGGSRLFQEGGDSNHIQSSNVSVPSVLERLQQQQRQHHAMTQQQQQQHQTQSQFVQYNNNTRPFYGQLSDPSSGNRQLASRQAPQLGGFRPVGSMTQSPVGANPLGMYDSAPSLKPMQTGPPLSSSSVGGSPTPPYPSVHSPVHRPCMSPDLPLQLAQMDRQREIHRSRPVPIGPMSTAGPGPGSSWISSTHSGMPGNQPPPQAFAMPSSMHQQGLPIGQGNRGISMNNPRGQDGYGISNPMKPNVGQQGHNQQQQHHMSIHHMQPHMNHPHHQQQVQGMQHHSGMYVKAPLSDMGQVETPLEETVVTSCREILQDASRHSLKAVELANTLRARVGTEVLGVIRERWGGLLSLLERHSDTFRVERIPKNDCVTLVMAGGGGSGASMLAYGRGSRDEMPPGFSAGTGAMMLDRHSPSHVSNMSGGGYPSTGQLNMQQIMTLKEGQVSNCLHVGNVPANITEQQLRREFERYGQLECLNIVSQRNRRFAFVSYCTVDQAVQAKQRLSKTHPWKSAISYARKDNFFKPPQPFGRNVERGYSMPIISEDNFAFQDSFIEPFGIERGSSMPIISPCSGPSSGVGCETGDMARQRSVSTDRFGSSNLQGTGMEYRDMASVERERDKESMRSPVSRPSGLHNQESGLMESVAVTPEQMEAIRRHMMQQQSQQEQARLSSHQQHFGMLQSQLLGDTMRGSSGFGSQDVPMSEGLLQSRQPQTQSSFPSSHSAYTSVLSETNLSGTLTPQNFDATVLRRLCDDTYVPTQTWPANSTADAPFCEVIVSQLQQLGGSTTVSKLRGALRHRISAQDNIKSVPLKALLSSYTEYFVLQGNQISLLNYNISNSMINGGMHLMGNEYGIGQEGFGMAHNVVGSFEPL